MLWCSAGEGALRDRSVLEFREDKKLETIVIEKKKRPTCLTPRQPAS
jgi:hypothetical protein